ncbi:hypothetical protein JKG47_01020 [Acidithiobacillus sp. MC6.1]|nr:hypothetical protein [Acidithiobacillus sp. MC6.1]
MHHVDLEVFVYGHENDIMEPVSHLIGGGEVHESEQKTHVRFQGELDDEAVATVMGWAFGLHAQACSGAAVILVDHGEPNNIEFHNLNCSGRNWTEELREIVCLFETKLEHLLHIHIG